MPFSIDSNHHFSQRPAIHAAAIDEMKRNTGNVFGRVNCLVKRDWILGTNRLERNFTHSQAPFIIEESLELSGKEDAKAAGELELAAGTMDNERRPYQSGVRHGAEVAAETRGKPVGVEGVAFTGPQYSHGAVQLGFHVVGRLFKAG